MLSGVSYYSNVNQSLKEIYEAHWETGNEVSSKSGNAIMVEMRKALDQEQTHWHKKLVTIKQGKNKGKTVRRFVYRNITRSIGSIVDRQGILMNIRLQNLIQFRTYGKSGVTVVAAAMKGGQTEIRENGVVKSSKRVHTVGEGSINILQKINYGLNSSSDKVKNAGNEFDWQGKRSTEKFEGTHEDARSFAERGIANADAKVKGYLTRGFGEAIARREKTISSKMVKVA